MCSNCCYGCYCCCRCCCYCCWFHIRQWKLKWKIANDMRSYNLNTQHIQYTKQCVGKTTTTQTIRTTLQLYLKVVKKKIIFKALTKTKTKYNNKIKANLCMGTSVCSCINELRKTVTFSKLTLSLTLFLNMVHTHSHLVPKQHNMRRLM